MMILEVTAVVSRALKRDERSPLSVASIQTTRPLYLVFDSSADAPAAVVQFGSRDVLLRLHTILSELHAELPTLVPESLACVSWHGDTYAHIQAGLRGVPWINLRCRIGSLNCWTDLRQRARLALGEFHTAVRKRPDWQATMDLDVELLRQLRLAITSGVQWPTSVLERIRGAASRLESLGPTEWPYQHGDFCFNNLLVSDDALGLIDFEEFGQTAMPLHDELSLAFSADEFMANVCGAPSLVEHVRAMIGPTLTDHPELRAHVDGLVFHHLLWHINECTIRPTRAPLKVALANLVQRCADEKWQ